MIALMIVSGEVKHSVQDQNLDFLRLRMAQLSCVLSGDLGRNRNITRQGVRKTRLGHKREHIRGLVLPSKAAVERAQFAAASDEDVDRTT
jgi:hypothetical protein